MASRENAGSTVKCTDKRYQQRDYNRRSRLFAAVAATAITSSGLLVHHATAGTNGVWSDLSTSGGLWSNTANWQGGIIASGTDAIATFNTPGVANTVHLNSAYTLGTISFNNSSTTLPWTIDNNNVSTNILTLATSTGVPVISTTTAGSTSTISAALAGTQGFTFNGPGNLALNSSSSTISGAINVDGPSAKGGYLLVQNSGALGNASSVYVLCGAGSGSTTTGMQIAGGVTLPNIPITLDINQTGRIDFDTTGSGTATIGGNVTVTDGSSGNIAEFQMEGSSMTFNGNVSVTNYANANFQLRATSGGSGDVATFNGALTLPAGVTFLLNQDGGFTFTALLNSNANSFTLFGMTYGTVKTGVNGALPAASVFSDATVGATSGVLDLFGTTQTITGLNENSNGNYTIGSSSNTSGSVLTLNNSTGTTYNFRGTIVDTLTTNGLTGTKTVALALQQGTQTLSGADTFSGGTTITGGTLNLNNSSALGTGSVTVTGPGTFDNIAGTYATVRNLTLNGATITANTGLNSSSNGAYGLLGTVTVGGTAASSIVAGSGASNDYVQIGNTSSGSTTAFNIASTGASGADFTVNVPIANYQNGTSFTTVANLTKTGAGTMRVNSSNTYTGVTNISGGTFQLGSGGSIAASTAILVGTGATFDTAPAGGYTTLSNQVLEGTGSINGLVTHNAGLIVPGVVNTSGGLLTFNTGLTLNGGSLQFNLTAAPGASNNSQIAVTTANGLTNSASSTPLSIQFLTLPTGSVVYPLFDYTGTLGGNWTSSGFNITTNAGRDTLALDTSTPGVVKLDVTATQANLVWASTSSNSWDIQSSKNWNNTTTPTLNPDYFYNGDVVTFNDSAGVVTGISINATVQPTAVFVTSNTNNYTFSGSGGISGNTGLYFTGSSYLTLETSNNYAGPTNISSGTLDVGGSTSSGTIGTGPVLNNGTLVFSRSDGSSSTPDTFANTITGTGQLSFTGTGYTTLTGPVTQNAVSINSSGGTLTTSGLLTLSSGITVTNGSLISNGGYNGSGGATINGGLLVISGSNAYTGAVTINSGGLFYPESNSAFGAGAGPVTVNDGGGIYFLAANGVFGTQPMTISGQGPGSAGALHSGGNTTATYGGTVTAVADSLVSADSGSTLVLSNASALVSSTNANVTLTGGGSVTFEGNLNLGAGSLVNNLSGNLNFNIATSPVINVSSSISGSGNIVIYGLNASSGQVNFLVDNSYTGNTTISSGILAISTPNGLGAAGGGSSGYTYISGGTATLDELQISGNITVGEYFILGGKQPGAPGVDAHIRNVSGVNTLTGQITASTNGNQYDVQSDSGLLNIAGGYTQTGGSGPRFLNLQGAGNGLFSSAIVDGTAQITVSKLGTGTWTFGVANSYTGPTNVSAGTLVIAAPGGIPNFTGVNMTGGLLQTNQSSGTKNTLFLSSLSFGGNTGAWAGTVDIANNDMVVQNGSLPNITNQIQEGWNNGRWNGGGGIISSTAANDGSRLTAVGAILNTADGVNTLYSSFDGASQSAITDVLVKFTYYGDANLDGKVDGSDYSLIDSSFQTESTTGTNISGWYNGDFNYDGVVNGSDYTLIDNAYNSQTAVITSEVATTSVQIDGGAGTSAVPEPAALGLLGIGAMGLLGRRNHRRL